MGKENDDTMGQNSCQPEGLQPESAAHRSVEQGPRLRGCDRGADQGRVHTDPFARLRGQIPEGALFRPPTRPACGDATVKVCESCVE